MGHWCLKKSDYMGGWVLSENQLLIFDRYIKWNVPVSIKISNPNLPVFLLCEIVQSTHKLTLFVLFLLLYVPSQQLWSWRDGQFT